MKHFDFKVGDEFIFIEKPRISFKRPFTIGKKYKIIAEDFSVGFKQAIIIDDNGTKSSWLLFEFMFKKDKSNINVCTHELKIYVGFNEKFDYCDKCNLEFNRRKIWEN